ncbi:MAG: TRAP transporter small permease [Synergistaceae bacterium]|jgi:TRAP-type C4-dicarboxylate transport system permease small subunit|nr:TRAP transporter small permease [Synergistaceae bacterium]
MNGDNVAMEKKKIEKKSSFFDRIVQWGNALEKILEFPLFILAVSMFFIVFWGVIFRYILRSPLSWSEELSRYLMIWMALLSVSLGLWRHEHIGISMFIKRLPRFIAKCVIFLSNGLILYFLYVLLFYGAKMTEGGKAQFSTALGTSMYWWLMAVPASAFFCVIFLLGKMIVDIRRTELDEILMSEDIVDTVKREEGLEF